MNDPKNLAGRKAAAGGDHNVSPGLLGGRPPVEPPPRAPSGPVPAPARMGPADGAPARMGPAGGAPAPADTVPLSINRALDQALRHYGAGRLDIAESICSQIIAARPRVAQAHNLLGAVQIARGDAAAAVKSFQRAVRLDEGNAQYHANLGETERQRGKLREASIALSRAVELDPRSAQALNNLGIVHFDRKEYAEAAEHYQRAIALNATYPEAHNNLGNALRMQGKRDEALEEYQKALLIRENYPEAYNNLATVLREQDHIAEAEHAYRKAIELRPIYLDAYNNLSILLAEDDRIDEALRMLGQALEIDSRDVATLVHVARLQSKKGNHQQAEQACRHALAIDPRNAAAHAMLGEVLHDNDRFTEALASFEAALAIDPELWDTHNLYGVCLKSVGRMEDARQQFRKSLEINPEGLGCYSNLADLEKFTPDNPHFQAMERIMGEADDPMSERYMALHFALGKAYDDIGDYQKAIEHFAAGATTKRAKLDYDEPETLNFFDSIIKNYDEEYLANPPFRGNPSPIPVFIVGMPRSGSTLVEQILSSHPQAHGAGETKEFSRRLGALRSRFPALPKYPDLGRKMNSAQYQIVAEGYLSGIRALGGNAQRITDKLLTNYFFVGMLHVLFPNAKFINTRRNPIDTCLSCYSKMFKDDMPHSYDFGELGRYYRKYEELMAHWERLLPPGVMTTVVYENVVANLEGAARHIVDFVGLPWDPACLAFHESMRPVKTASVVQVRKPVYTSSVERWRRYGPALQPLIDALGYNAENTPA
jgi:tetratricopeptide (TPR) repeat protein